MDRDIVETAGSHEPEWGRTPWKAAIAGWVGSALEYYDFFIYGTAAALVFPDIFFPKGNPTVATIGSLATFGVGYVARPVGSFFMGHWGDKLGRKRVLILTLLLMGTATFLVGCLPTYQQVGLWAPGLLVALRLLQGFSASGEQSGANSMTLEHAPPRRRAFYSSFVLNGTQAGSLLANAVFLPLAAALSAEQLRSWGWRIPFFVSVLVMIAGYVIRRTLNETPAFQEEEAHGEVPKMPLGVLFRHHWVDVIRVVFIALISVVSTIFGVYALSFATDTVGVSSSDMLWVGILANLVALGAIPAWAFLADHIGRKPVFLFGTLGCAVMIFLYLWAISTGNVPLIFAFGILQSGIVYSAANGLQPALYGEMFSTRVRLSGMAVGTQFGYALGGFSPTIAAVIAGNGTGGWVPVAIFVAGCCILSTIAVATGPETYKIHMNDLGKKLGKKTASVALTRA